jgi:ABC transport system ATP-binding/permease protein
MRTDSRFRSAVPGPEPELASVVGVGIDVVGVTARAADRPVLNDLSLSVAPGELVALVGGSGAGKTTLLETMAGLRPIAEGAVLHDGVAVRAEERISAIGYVPQDDIVHRELSLRRVVRYAAALRLPAGTSPAGIDQVVERTLRALDLAGRADVTVGDLSGGQRKRASIAVELLTRPRVLFLDEPTSGLDPSTASDVLGVLRRLAHEGVTVVLSTHNPTDIDACDRVIFLASGGHLAFSGSPHEAREYFEVADLARVYRCLAEEASPSAWADRFAAGRTPTQVQPVRPASRPVEMPTRIGAVRQWAILTRRNAEVIVRNRLTLAVLVGSPLLVTAMMVVLFRPGAFAVQRAGSPGPVQMVFWIAFDGFFFGLTYGLLQIVGEMPVLRREYLAGLNLGAYVLSKVAVLAPMLAVAATMLLGALRIFDRLPALDWTTYGVLLVTLILESLCALALGLLASAAVRDAAQATLALPMLCFPQVLFAGAVVPVAAMAAPGRVMSFGMANRWAFESLGRALHLGALGAHFQGVTPYRDAFTGPATVGWIVLAAFALAFTLATVVVLQRRCRPGRSHRRWS